jgi:hypothetical protein
VLAPHVEFDEDRHEYWYKRNRLSGVTGLISKKLGLKMPQEFVEEHQEEGVHVHRTVQKWIETDCMGTACAVIRKVWAWEWSTSGEAGLTYWPDMRNAALTWFEK